MAKSVQIKSINHWHEQVVDWMLCNPHLKLGQCAVHFDVTANWISSLIHTDLFEEYKSLRFQQHQDRVSHSVISHVSGLAGLSLGVLQERIKEEKETIQLGLVKDVAEMTLKALGFGPKPTAASNTINLNLNGASPEILAEARETLKGTHIRNTQDVSEAKVLDDLPNMPLMGEG